MDRNQDKLGIAELIIAKQRNGPTDTVRLSWIEHCTRFKHHSSAAAPDDYDAAKAGREPNEPPI